MSNVIRLRIRPRWRRLLLAPELWLKHYRVFRKSSGRLLSAQVAARLVWLVVK